MFFKWVSRCFDIRLVFSQKMDSMRGADKVQLENFVKKWVQNCPQPGDSRVPGRVLVDISQKTHNYVKRSFSRSNQSQLVYQRDSNRVFERRRPQHSKNAVDKCWLIDLGL